MYQNLIIVLLAVAALAGCASCPVQTFTKIVPVNRANGVRAYTDGPTQTIFEVEPDVALSVRSCRGNVLCITINLPKGRRMQFATDEFAVLNAEGGNVTQIHKAERIHYKVVCKQTGTSVRSCSSSELSPTTNPVEASIVASSEHNGRKTQIYEKTFASTLEFVGERETFVSTSYGYREYELPILIGKQPDSQSYIVRFPLVIIDGNSYKLPEVLVAEVNEPLCTFRPW